VYLTELEGLTRQQPSLRVHPHVDETHGLLTAEHVLTEAGDTHDAEFFIAGPPAFSAALRKDLIAHHVAARRIHSERFEHL
jgi:ferredoxin-NADP reductase